MKRIETVTIIQRNPRILLGKKMKKLGAGRYNGFGGGIESEDEGDLYKTAIRETWEETGKGIKIINPRLMGRIYFTFEGGEQDHEVYFFKSRRYTGSPKNTDEMEYEWFSQDEIPYDMMWADDKYWLPELLKDKMFIGNFRFNADHKIVEHDLITNPGIGCLERMAKEAGERK